MSNSPLVSYTRISPNRGNTINKVWKPERTRAIDTITIHCVVGQCSVETLGNVFAPTSRQASSNYGVGYDGKIGMYVEEKTALGVPQVRRMTTALSPSRSQAIPNTLMR